VAPGRRSSRTARECPLCDQVHTKPYGDDVCIFCGRGHRHHRMVDTIRGRHHAGESVASLANDYQLSVARIRRVVGAAC
jgi:hypothetical protein